MAYGKKSGTKKSSYGYSAGMKSGGTKKKKSYSSSYSKKGSKTKYPGRISQRG